MKLRNLATLLFLFVPACCGTARAEAPADPNDESGFIALFDGKSLDGWRASEHRDSCRVENGEIVVGGGERSHLFYDGPVANHDFKNFELRLEVMTEPKANSGVYFHTAFQEGTATVTAGRQVEIDRVLGHHTGGIYGDGRGWVAWPAPEYETVIRPTDWNDMLIRVEGNRYVVILNGIQVLDFTYPSPVAEEGVIALQLHSGGQGRMRFKDLYVRDLSRP